MPTDPKTGEQLPYPGEPGAMEGEAPMPEKQMGSDDAEAAEMLKTIDDEIAKRSEESGMAEGAEGEGGDLKDLEETLGITPERAKMLFDAAQELEKTKGKSAKELAEMIAADFEVLMQLEMIAARNQDAPKEQPMPEQPQGMMPEGAPEMMPPMGPEGAT